MLSDPQARAQKVPEDLKVTWRHVFPKKPPRSPKVTKAPHHRPLPKLQDSERVGVCPSLHRSCERPESGLQPLPCLLPLGIPGPTTALSYRPWTSAPLPTKCCSAHPPPAPKLRLHGPMGLPPLRVPGQVASVPCWVGMRRAV